MSGPLDEESFTEDPKIDDDLAENISIFTDLTENISIFTDTPRDDETEDGYNSGEHYDTACMAGYVSGEMYDLPIADHPLNLKERRNSQIVEEDMISRDTATPPLDPYLIHEISGTPTLDISCDSDFTIQNMSYASDSSGPLLKSWDGRSRKRGAKKVNHEEKKKPRNRRHDHFFHIYDNKYWGFARVGLFWLSISGILSCIGSAAVMVILMPRQCDPPRGWWQGEAILEVAPTKKFNGAVWNYTIDVNELKDQVPLMKKAGFKVLKLKDIYVRHDKIEGNTWENPDDKAILNQNLRNMSSFSELVKSLHDNNMTLMVEIPAAEKGAKVDPGVARRNNITMELSQAVERGIKYWAVKGVDGIAIAGLQNFTGYPWMADNSKSWKKILEKYGTSPNVKILTSSYLVGPEAMANFDLLDDRTAMPRDSLISHVEEVARWDSSPSKPWINWDILTSSSAELALHVFLPGTITLRSSNNSFIPRISSSSNQVLHPNSLASHQVLHPNSLASHHLLHPNSLASNQVLHPNSLASHHLLHPNSLASHPVLHPNSLASHPVLHPNSLASHLLAIRSKAAPVHMNGNYRKCHGSCADVWTTKETNYKIHQLNNLVLLERFYNRRNRYMVIANLKEHAVHLEEVSAKYSGGQLILNTSSTVQTPRFIKFSQVSLDAKQALVIKFPK